MSAAFPSCVPKGQRKLDTGGVSHRTGTRAKSVPKGRQKSPVLPATLPGRDGIPRKFRWLTPPANLRRPSGTQQETAWALFAPPMGFCA
jgi:hypothetical protein